MVIEHFSPALHLVHLGMICQIHGLKSPASSGTLVCISVGYVVCLTRLLHDMARMTVIACLI
jgi:hypothetical protein